MILGYLVPFYIISVHMATPRVLILGHSFIRRLGEFVDHRSHLDRSFMLSGAAIFRWQGKGGRTLATIQDDLPVVKSFAPHIVILQLGTNDPSRLDPLLVGSAIEDLVRTLHDSYSVRLVCVCQTLYRDADSVFNVRVRALTKYLKVFLEPLPYSFLWGHRGFWRSTQRFHARDGVHLNNRGQFKLYRSLRGAVLKSLHLLARAN